MENDSTISTSIKNSKRLNLKTKLFTCVILRLMRINSRLKERIEIREDTIKGLSKIVQKHFKKIKRLENELQNRDN